MKRLPVIFFGLLLWGSLSLPLFADNQSLILNLANALSLWANDHLEKYPQLKEFYSPAFLPYWKKAAGQIPLPLAEREKINYTVSQDQKSFKLVLGEEVFSSRNGFPLRSQVSREEKKALKAFLQRLYQAFAQRNLAEILRLEKPAIEASARAYEAAGKGKGEKVFDAFKECTREIIEDPAFKMEPLNLKDLNFQKQGNEYKVSSYLPIFLSSRVMVQSGLEKQPIRLRIGELLFIKTDQGFELKRLTLY